jgi:hypothetical protein
VMMKHWRGIQKFRDLPVMTSNVLSREITEIAKRDLSYEEGRKQA